MKGYKGTHFRNSGPLFTFSRYILIFLSAATVLVNGCSEREQPKPIPEISVKTAPALEKDVPIEVPANGTVEAFLVVNITSRVDGQVMKIHIKEGQMVEKGQALVSIDERPYQAQAEAAEAALARDKIRLEKAAKDAERYSELVQKDYVTRAQYEQAIADSEALKAIVSGDEAALQNARINVDYCGIKAPITGRVGSILINEGNLVKANDAKPLMVINQVDPVLVRFSIPENRLPEIQNLMSRDNLKVLISTLGKQNDPMEGQLTFLDNTINPNTGTITLKATLANADRRLWPGQFVNVVLLLGIQPKAVVVPSEAVQIGQQGNFVFVVKSDLTVESRLITPGARIDQETVIEKGLSTGEIVVTDGQLKLTPGAKVVLKNKIQASGDSRS